MLCFAKFLEGTLFEGSILAWIVGAPILVFIIFFDRKLKIDLLLINVNKYESGEDIIAQASYLQSLIRADNKTSSILIDGYIEVHRQTCTKDDCPAKNKQSNKKKAEIIKEEVKEQENNKQLV
jgi:hypothetical protein